MRIHRRVDLVLGRFHGRESRGQLRFGFVQIADRLIDTASRVQIQVIDDAVHFAVERCDARNRHVGVIDSRLDVLVDVFQCYGVIGQELLVDLVRDVDVERDALFAFAEEVIVGGGHIVNPGRLHGMVNSRVLGLFPLVVDVVIDAQTPGGDGPNLKTQVADAGLRVDSRRSWHIFVVLEHGRAAVFVVRTARKDTDRARTTLERNCRAEPVRAGQKACVVGAGIRIGTDFVVFDVAVRDGVPADMRGLIEDQADVVRRIRYELLRLDIDFRVRRAVGVGVQAQFVGRAYSDFVVFAGYRRRYSQLVRPGPSKGPVGRIPRLLSGHTVFQDRVLSLRTRTFVVDLPGQLIRLPGNRDGVVRRSIGQERILFDSGQVRRRHSGLYMAGTLHSRGHGLRLDAVENGADLHVIRERRRDVLDSRAGAEHRVDAGPVFTVPGVVDVEVIVLRVLRHVPGRIDAAGLDAGVILIDLFDEV